MDINKSKVGDANLLYAQILDFLDESIDNINNFRFNDLPLQLFEHQFKTNDAYQKYCIKKGKTPENVSKWIEIPAIPTDAFKYTDLACFPTKEAVKAFRTSGTSDPKKRGIYYLDEEGLKIYEKALMRGYEEFMIPDKKKMRILALSPPPQVLPNMAMANAIGLWMDKYGTKDSIFLIGKEGLDFEEFVALLKESEEKKEPISIIGASFGYVHFFDNCKKKGIKFNLPEGSRTIDGGGYKGRSREVSKEEFFSKFPEIFGISKDYCINLLGMTEDASQYYDNVLRNKIKGIKEPRYKPNYPWTRTVAMNPEDLDERLECDIPMEGWPECYRSEVGLLRHYDLANTSTVLAIQTDDLGYEVKTPYGSGFEILGRAKGAEARGCSLAIEELIGDLENE